MIDKEKRNKRNNTWIKENRERINLVFRIGTKERVKTAAAHDGVSMAQWVQAAIDEKLKSYNI